VVEGTTALAPPGATNLWTIVPPPYETNSTLISVTVTPNGNRFFRLRNQ
jgi:hypothetical protein